MPIPLEYSEVWFQLAVAGDNEPMYTHLAYGTTAITQAAVDAGFTVWTTSLFRSRWNTEMTLLGGHVLQQTVVGIRRWDASITPLAGSGAGTLLPNNCAVLAKKSTALGGRRNRGRMYLPCPQETETSSAGVVSPTGITAWNAALALLMPGGSIHTGFGFLGDPVVLHETGSQTPAVITDLACQPKIATQRRRMRG